MALNSNSLEPPKPGLQSVFHTVGRSVQSYPLAFLLTLAAVLRSYHVWVPIIGVHAWRQSDTAAMARNFYENGFRLLYPQIDWGGSSPGFAETEFPIYSYAVALIYKLLGVSDAYGRLLSIICALISIYFLYKLVTLICDRQVAFWSSFFYTILPLNVFYSRTFQPESMLLMACIIGLYGFVCWLREQNDRYLVLSAAFVTLACLIKVLPVVYVGLPLLFLAGSHFKGRLFWQWRLWLYAAVVLGATTAWYFHAHQIFLETGLGFGFWGSGSARYTWHDLLRFQFWGDILLRLVVRHFAILGSIIFGVGLLSRRRFAQARLFEVGMISVLLACALAPTSSYVHEYYQLPLMIYAVPFMGKAWVAVITGSSRLYKRLFAVCLALMIVAGSAIYTIDYMMPEALGRSEVYALAQQVQANTPANARVVAVTAGDPNLLYLADRKGWLTGPGEVTQEFVEAKAAAGADYLVGSYQVVESHSAFTNEAQKAAIRSLIDDHLDAVIQTERFYIARLPRAE